MAIDREAAIAELAELATGFESATRTYYHKIALLLGPEWKKFVDQDLPPPIRVGRREVDALQQLIDGEVSRLESRLTELKRRNGIKLTEEKRKLPVARGLKETDAELLTSLAGRGDPNLAQELDSPMYRIEVSRRMLGQALETLRQVSQRLLGQGLRT